MRSAITLLLCAAAAAGCGSDKGATAGGNGNVAPPAVSARPAAPVAGRPDRSHAGTPAPSAVFENAAGEPTTLAAFRGRPTLVNLWATWCAPCVVELPALDALAVREGDALQVVALSQDVGGRGLVTEFLGARRLQALEANLDGQMALMTALGVSDLPTTVLYDARGREVWRMTGPAEWESERVARLLDEAEGG